MLSDLYRGSSIFLILWWLWVSCDKSPTGVSLRWSAHSREDRPQRCSDFGSLLGNFKPWPSEPAPVGSTCEWVTTRLAFLSVTLLDRIVFNDLLLCSCPYQDDRYLTTLIPVDGSSGLLFPTHYKRFVLKMFTFVEPATLAPLMEKVLHYIFFFSSFFFFFFFCIWLYVSKICSLPGFHSLQYISLYPNSSRLLCLELQQEEWVLLLLNGLWHTWALFWLSSLLQREMLGNKQRVPLQLSPVEKLSLNSCDSFCNKLYRFWIYFFGSFNFFEKSWVLSILQIRAKLHLQIWWRIVE